MRALAPPGGAAPHLAPGSPPGGGYGGAGAGLAADAYAAAVSAAATGAAPVTSERHSQLQEQVRATAAVSDAPIRARVPHARARHTILTPPPRARARAPSSRASHRLARLSRARARKKVRMQQDLIMKMYDELAQLKTTIKPGEAAAVGGEPALKPAE